MIQLVLLSLLASATGFAQEQKLTDYINKKSQETKVKKVTKTKQIIKNNQELKLSLSNKKLKQNWQKKLEVINKKNAKAQLKMARSSGGSAIGGGNLYNDLIGWCDEGSMILDEARIEAQDIVGTYNDKISAIQIYYNGLIQALEAASEEEINVHSSITYRAIVRGLNLAQIMGVLDIVSGSAGYSNAAIMDAVYFLDDYFQFLLNITYTLDRQYYMNYYANEYCRNCRNLPGYSIKELENKFIDYSVSQIEFWTKKFIKYRSNGEGSYPTINIQKAMEGLAYLSVETAKDLDESLFNKVFACQSSRFKRLSLRISRYLNRGGSDTLHAAKLTMFKEQVNKIIDSLSKKDCRF